MLLSIVNYKNEIDGLFDHAKSLPQEERILSHWAKYICVRCCGFLEECTTELLIDAARKQSSRRIIAFVESKLYNFQNPKTGKIEELLGEFDEVWKTEFQSWLDEKRKGSINSIVTNRHLIAHGESSEVTLSRVKNYWEDVKEYATWLDTLLSG